MKYVKTFSKLQLQVEMYYKCLYKTKRKSLYCYFTHSAQTLEGVLLLKAMSLYAAVQTLHEVKETTALCGGWVLLMKHIDCGTLEVHQN